jgi:hypothetical protein
MASSSIEFDVEQLIGQLNAVQGTQIKYAGTQAMKRLGYELQQDIHRHMAQVFDRPVALTLRAVRYEANGLQTMMRIIRDAPKGQDPGRYLYPVSTEDGAGTKQAYITRFTKALRYRDIIPDRYFAIPWSGGRGVPIDDHGNVPRTFYASVLAGLARGNKTKKDGPNAGYRYFSVPDGTRSGKTNNPLYKRPPAIYRAKGRDLQLLFTYADKHPTVPTTFDFSGYAFRRAEQILPTLLSQELEKAMR